MILTVILLVAAWILLELGMKTEEEIYYFLMIGTLGFTALIMYQDIDETRKENAKERSERYEIELNEYLENNESTIVDEILIRDIQVNFNNDLEIEVLIKEKDKYAEEFITDFEETLGEDRSPYVEYVELKEDIVYKNKGEKIMKLYLPKDYLQNNFSYRKE